jgi:uncharacterized protein (TIGR02246 family)
LSEQLIQRYFDAINTEDWDTFSGLWADDAVYSTTGARPREGRDSIVEFFKGLFASWSVHNDEPVKATVSDGSARVEVFFTGTTLDGRPLSFDAVDDFSFSDGKLTKGSTTYDLDHVRKLLAGEPV